MSILPEGFAALEPFVERWAISGTANRAVLRGNSSAEERQALYAAAMPLAGAALDYLDSRPWGKFDAAEEQLMKLMLSFAHVSIAVEIQQEDEAKHAALRAHMPVTHSPADEVPA
jgi:hypothetical protein